MGPISGGRGSSVVQVVLRGRLQAPRAQVPGLICAQGPLCRCRVSATPHLPASARLTNVTLLPFGSTSVPSPGRLLDCFEVSGPRPPLSLPGAEGGWGQVHPAAPLQRPASAASRGGPGVETATRAYQVVTRVKAENISEALAYSWCSINISLFLHL